MISKLTREKTLSEALTLLLVSLLAVGLVTTPTNKAVADSSTPRPAPAFPAFGQSDQSASVRLQEDSTLEGASLNTLNSAETCNSVFQGGGDRLAELQNNDGGWDWPLDDDNPDSASPGNTVGPIAMGLAHAYLHTDDSDHLAALSQAGAFLLAKTNNFSPSDGYLAAQLDRIFGGTTYVSHVMQNFYGPLDAGAYNRNGAGNLYDTAAYVDLIRTARASQGIPNLAAWDIGLGLVGASAAGADTLAWIGGVRAEIDELDGNAYYDVIGLAGAVYGLASVNEDFDPTLGEHFSASSLSDLASILASYQIDGGGFTWNKDFTNPGEFNETIQETAYAVLALNEFDRTTYSDAIQGAVIYMEGVQLATGGWKNWEFGGENNEITGEALWAISVALPGPVTSNAVASPNPVAVSGQITLLAMADSTAVSCAKIASAEYSLEGAPWEIMQATDEAFDDATEEVRASFAAPSTPGIYELCVRSTDAIGNTGAKECIMLVVYDPDGGFVTGGGWIDSPSDAYKAPTLVWDQGFEVDAAGWFDSDDSWYGTVNRVPSGANGITSSAGSYHGIFEGDADSAPFSRFDGYRDTWTGTWTAEVDVYLDPAWTSGQGFDYSVAASGSDGNHQRDYIFHVTKDTSTGKLLVAGSNNTNFAPREDLENINHYEVTVAGWYTLQHVFYNDQGALAVDMNLLDGMGSLLFTETRYNQADLIPDEVGGNRYAWFTFISVSGGIAVDNHQLVVSSAPTGKATFGFVAKYKKGAQTPDGNTEFVFKAADLNFHSTSYDWLVVNQGGSSAQFKGLGTINGGSAPNGEGYRFMLWAGDGEPDTFRIKIWWEEDDTEHVIYDNGMDQPLGSGNIVIHTSKK